MNKREISYYSRALIIFGLFVFMFVEKDLFDVLSEKVDIYYILTSVLLVCLVFIFKNFEYDHHNELTFFKIKVSPAVAVSFISILIFELPVAFLLVAVGYMISLIYTKEKEGMERFFADYFSEVLTMGATILIYSQISHYFGESLYDVKLIMLALLYMVFSVALKALQVASEMKVSFRKIFRDVVFFIYPVLLFYFSSSLLVFIVFKSIGYPAFILFALLYFGNRSFIKLLINESFYEVIVKVIVEAASVDRKDFEKMETVQRYAVIIGREFGLQEEDLKNLGYASLLHDIGKVGVDEFSLDYILENISSKDGKLLHSEIGSEIAKTVPFLSKITEVIKNHHKPFSMHKTKGFEKGVLPLMSRVIAAADGYVGLITAEAEEERLTPKEAYRKMRKEQGIVYDPKLVRSLKRILEKEGLFTSKEAY